MDETINTKCHFCEEDMECVNIVKEDYRVARWYCETCSKLTLQDELHVMTVPLMDWLGANFHPHVKVIVDSGRVELVEGIHSTGTRPAK